MLVSLFIINFMSLTFAIFDNKRIKKMAKDQETIKRIQPHLSDFKSINAYIYNAISSFIGWILVNTFGLPVNYIIVYFIMLLYEFLEDFWYAILFNRNEFYR